MRSAGVPERLITGDADPEEKFLAGRETVPKLIGNPLYHWTHLELQRYFGIGEPLSGRNAKAVYRACNEALAKPELSVRGIIKKSNVKLICTTDDPADGLSAHARIAADPTCEVAVLPAFRPDKAMRADKRTLPRTSAAFRPRGASPSRTWTTCARRCARASRTLTRAAAA